MCKVYNAVGSLTVIKQCLHQHNIYDFNSLKEVITFQNSYNSYQERLISDHKLLIEQERDRLFLEIMDLDDSIKTEKNICENKLRQHFEKLQLQIENIPNSINAIQRIINYFKKKYYKKKIRNSLASFDSKVADSVQQLVKVQREKDNRYQFLLSDFEGAVNVSFSKPLVELERKKRVVDDLNSSIYGALGEHKVVKELEHLSDDYFLINDFCLEFKPAIYNHQEKDYVKSIQIDHILVAPSGIFLIETKNWSEKSLNNLGLRSPITQVKRTSFVLFKLLTQGIGDNRLRLRKHHWGIKKIPIKNIITLINSKPKEEFQYVKILTANELVNYIQYFAPIFSNNETQEIANYLLNLSNQKIINIK